MLVIGHVVHRMGVRAGQGFGLLKPKRMRCPECRRKGVTQWQASAAGLSRYCQYCRMAWGEAGWALARRDLLTPSADRT